MAIIVSARPRASTATRIVASGPASADTASAASSAASASVFILSRMCAMTSAHEQGNQDDIWNRDAKEETYQGAHRDFLGLTW